MKLLVIVTRMYEECKNDTCEFTQWKCDKNENIHKFNEYGFLCIHGCKYKKDIERKKIKIAVKVNNIWKKIQKKIKGQKLNEIGIIFHPHYDANMNSEDEILKQWGIFVEAFKKKKGTKIKKINSIQISFVETYSSAMRKDIYKKIENLCKSCSTQKKGSEKLIKELWEHFSKEKKTEENEENVKFFSILKHQITDLLLPLDMNLQGIYEISKKSKEKAVEHLKDILKNKNKNPAFYRQKLADLQFMVAKVQTNNKNPKLNCNAEPSKNELVKPKVKEDNLPDKKSILNLIPKDKKEKVKEEWENLLKLSGIGLKENNSDIFDKNSLEPKFNSPIFLFMRLLDCKIVKYSNQITINDVDEILNFEPLKKLLEEIGLHSFSLNPFSHWYNFLNSYLDKLREKIVKEEEK